MRLFSYMVLDRALQLGASFSALLLVGQTMSAGDFRLWTASVGAFASFSAFLYAFPAEPLVRSLLTRPHPLHAARLLVVSVLARGAWSIVLCLTIWLWWQMSPGTTPFARNVLLALLVCAALAETLAFAVTLTLRADRLSTLLIARIFGTVGKLSGIALAIALSAPMLLLAVAFSIDALTITFACWHFGLSDRSWFARQSIRMVRRVSLHRLMTQALRAFVHALPSTALVVAYNALLRSDRLILTHIGTTQVLSAQSVCMQFIDPAVMFLSGYVNNHFVQSRSLPRRKIFFLLGALLLGGVMIAALGPTIMGWLPRNIAEASIRFEQVGWLLPTYGAFSMTFYTMYYHAGDRAAAVLLGLFGLGAIFLPLLGNWWFPLGTQPYLILCIVTWIGACLVQWRSTRATLVRP